ncbi:MAG: phosphatase PAP2 family protein [Patescibacteria group bacterium]
MTFDTTVFSLLFGVAHISPLLNGLIIFFARYLPYLIAISAAIIILLEPTWKKKFWAFSLVSLTLLLGKGIINEAIQFFYTRLRPPIVLGIEPLIPLPQAPSFPSSHAVIMFGVAMAIFFVHKKWGAIFLGLAALVALARVMAGVHWPLDILAGAIIGMGAAYIMKKLIPKREELS